MAEDDFKECAEGGKHIAMGRDVLDRIDSHYGSCGLELLGLTISVSPSGSMDPSDCCPQGLSVSMPPSLSFFQEYNDYWQEPPLNASEISGLEQFTYEEWQEILNAARLREEAQAAELARAIIDWRGAPEKFGDVMMAAIRDVARGG